MLVKRNKKLFEQSTDISIEGRFIETNAYFIRKGNTYYPLENKKSLVKVLADRKKELQSFIRSNKLKFRENREADILQLVQYYAQLSK